MEDIATSWAEQTNGVDNVNRAISHIDSMTQHNTAIVEQLARIAEKLSSESDTPSRAVGQFKVSRDLRPGNNG
ncbi:MAG: methyl-accepting chemotaxis protein [Desulfomonilia bacterium]|jgi:methyl-accepting chemotaxis protein